MLQRKILDQLSAWKNNPRKMALVVKGARQVGKTFSIEQFAGEQYFRSVYINFDENPAYRAIFEGDLDMDTLIKQISLRVPNAELVPGETLIFLDEIQNCPQAQTALKFITMDKRFDCIATGSLLGVCRTSCVKPQKIADQAIFYPANSESSPIIGDFLRHQAQKIYKCNRLRGRHGKGKNPRMFLCHPQTVGQRLQEVSIQYCGKKREFP